jgi:hypothetical protein
VTLSNHAILSQDVVSIAETIQGFTRVIRFCFPAQIELIIIDYYHHQAQ